MNEEEIKDLTHRTVFVFKNYSVGVENIENTKVFSSKSNLEIYRRNHGIPKFKEGKGVLGKFINSGWVAVGLSTYTYIEIQVDC